MTTSIADDTITAESAEVTNISFDDSTCDSGVNISTREVASHGESTSYDLVDEPRVNGSDVAITAELPTISSPLKRTIQRSSSRRSRRNDSATYELSVDLRDKAIEILEHKYGGKEKSNKAARAIQQCYRRWKLSKSFHRMRAFSGRKYSITRMPEQHFEKLKKSSLVFYGPENPVMIVDDEEAEIKTSSPLEPNTSLASALTPDNIAAVEIDTHFISGQEILLDSHSTDSEDSEHKEDEIVEGLDDDDDESSLTIENTSQKSEDKVSTSLLTFSVRFYNFCLYICMLVCIFHEK